MTTTSAGSPGITLDTNVLLDWLVFNEPSVAHIVAAVQTGAVRWIACEPMRVELSRTLGYDNLARWAPNRERALALFDLYAVMERLPPTLAMLRCSDPDDQIFLDLAVATGSRWLLTHDRALLRLAKRARGLGVQVMRPTTWLSI